MDGIALESVNPVVFDDPDYCEKDDDNRCKYLMYSSKSDQDGCYLFPKKKSVNSLWCEPTELEYNWQFMTLKKFQQCIEHYQTAKTRSAAKLDGDSMLEND